LTVLLVIGIVVYLLLLYLTSQAVTAEVRSVDNVQYDPVINMINVCFDIQVVNDGYIDLTIEKIYYKIYINGKYVGEGLREIY